MTSVEAELGAARRVGAVAAVDVVLCAVPLERPIRLGAVEYREREYAVVRVRTDGGVVGSALGYTRGLPLFEALAGLAPSLLGREVTRRERVLSSLADPYGNAAVALVRALSLIDIALWDALAGTVALPLWRLLGGARDRVELLAVGGYFLGERTLDDVEGEIRSLAEAGFRHIKVHATDPQLVARLKRAAGDSVRFSVDAHMAWRTLPQALATCRALDDLGLAFLEDPFPPQAWRLTAELGARLRTPLAAGEDAPGPEALRELAGAVSVLRVDATASGGIGAVAAVAAGAAAAGRSVMTHAFPDFHAHLGGGLPAIGSVEMIPYESGANPVDVLMARRQKVEAGELVLSEEPGHGMPLDWEAVLRFARRRVTCDGDDPSGRSECS